VRLGGTTGELVEVSSGVQPGERVVTNGSFFLRAERERLGLRPAASVGAGGPAVGSRNDSGGKTADGVQRARVVVNEQGFEPATVTLRAGMPARITFVRTTDKTCGTEVVFPSLKIERALPLNQPVSIDFRPARTGDIAFACGMTMLKGVVVVE
jgi:hypothetical protein